MFKHLLLVVHTVDISIGFESVMGKYEISKISDLTSETAIATTTERSFVVSDRNTIGHSIIPLNKVLNYTHKISCKLVLSDIQSEILLTLCVFVRNVGLWKTTLFVMDIEFCQRQRTFGATFYLNPFNR